ncbi:MAG TPA: phytochelatin synthase family protein [Polyangiaceae bacterium]|nr:phytochelatin synthase family protein [Polyangiaceae bacterium]
MSVVQETLYRRPIPAGAVAFSSPEGRQLFAEALASGGLEGYFPLAEQFHTQSEPSFCGLGSLVVALNALGVDPGRLWKGPWRWFAEELLDCCVPLSRVRERGLEIEELACLARCNGASVELQYAEEVDAAAFRRALADAARGASVLIASYDRSALGQTGSGHFSPVGGYFGARDLALVLDVARFKYPPHWLSAELLFGAMLPRDPATGRSRGWLGLRRREQGIALGFSVKCEGESWRGIAERLEVVEQALRAARDLPELVRAVEPLVAQLELRTPTTAAHRDALGAALSALRELSIYPEVEAQVGATTAEAVTLLVAALAPALAPAGRALVAPASDASDAQRALAQEIDNVRAQLAALAQRARPALTSPAAR